MMTLFATTMSLFHYVNVPVEPMREAPYATSEIVSQAIFSEAVILTKEVDGKEGDAKEAEEWVEIETAVDHYRGFVRKNTLCSRAEPFPLSPLAKCVRVNRLAAHLYAVEDTIYGPLVTLPFESQLQCVEPVQEGNGRWIKVAMPDGRQGYIQRGDIKEEGAVLTMEEMCALSMRFIGLPYTWGGRSSFGYDCSGLVQMLYRQMGVYLPRDSKIQAQWEGFKSVPLESLQAGDLIFFGLSEEKIRHVGMYLKEGSLLKGDSTPSKEGYFVHATVAENAPYIHISNLNDAEWNGTSKWGYRTARRLK